MAAIETGLFQKLISFMASPLTQAASTAIELGGRKAGEKLTQKIGNFFEIGQRSLGDEILTDNTLTHLSDQAVCDAFERFMVWLQIHPSNGVAKAEKIREIIVKKISSKEVRKKGGKKDANDETSVSTEYDYSLAVDFIKRMMSQGDHDEIHHWLEGKNFFSTITTVKISGFENAAAVVKDDAKNAAGIVTQELNNFSNWLNSKSRK